MTPQPPLVQWRVLAAAACALALLAAALPMAGRLQVLLVLGAALGLALYFASFGFTAAFRVLMVEGRSAGLRAQMAMLALACVLFFPALSAGRIFGQDVSGFVFAVGPGIVAGGFLFGIGMQLGGGCGSGTLFTSGGGNARMLLTLIFFIAGSMVGYAHVRWWDALPAIPAVSAPLAMGWPAALALHLAIFAGVYFAAQSLERRRHGSVAAISHWRMTETQRPVWSRHWPVLAGALSLAVLNFATLLAAGRPWGITGAFALWGASALDAVGVPVSTWPSWSDDGSRAWLAAGVLGDATSVMDFGLMAGAAAAAALTGEFRPNLRIPARQVAASVIGGLLMGYGARIGYGCNIGAYFSAIASGSLHGWVWIGPALAGNWVGIQLRPAFGMPK